MQQEEKKMKPANRNTFAGGLILCGVIILLAPAISQKVCDHRINSVVDTYIVTSEEKVKDGKSDVIFSEVDEYNKRLRLGKGTTGDEYLQLLSEDGNGMMGYIEIPAINVTVPVFHHNDEGMSRGAIHVLGSSLPVGGKGTHSVIAAHTGNENGKFFTDLSKLKIGDSFSITVLDRKLDYVVDQIKTVLPDDNHWLKISETDDYCTLLTCTPYGVNSHRLLVRGKHVEASEIGAESAAAYSYKKPDSKYVAVDAMGVILFLAVLLLWIIMIKTRGRKSELFKRTNK